jgi:hypothetical protein
MKTTPIILFVFLFSLKVVAQTKKVAVISLQADKLILVDGIFGGLDTEVVRVFKDLSKDPRFDVNPLLSQFHDEFWNYYAKNMPVGFLDEKEVINNKAYQDFTKKLINGNETGNKLLNTAIKLEERNTITYPGYQLFFPVSNQQSLADKIADKISGTSDTMPNPIAVFDGKVDGLMYIDLGFEMTTKKSLIGFATGGLISDGRMAAFINIGLYNKEGKKVFAFKEKGYSEEGFDEVANVALKVKPENVLPMCQSAVTNLFKVLEKKIPSMTKKIDAKL